MLFAHVNAPTQCVYSVGNNIILRSPTPSRPRQNLTPAVRRKPTYLLSSLTYALQDLGELLILQDGGGRKLHKVAPHERKLGQCLSRVHENVSVNFTGFLLGARQIARGP
jgi:hypothetical protein